MSHTFKAFLKIIHKGIYGKCEEKLDNKHSLVLKTIWIREKHYIVCNYSYKNVIITNEKIYLYALSIIKKHLTTYDMIY